MPELRPYQLEAIKDILDKKKILIADDMGMGKCAEAIAAKTAYENRQGYDSKALIVSPASVAQHWEDEIKLWYKKKYATKITNIQTSSYDADVKQARNSDFAIISYPTLSYLGSNRNKINSLKSLGFQYGIIDEAHNAKNPDSIRSLAVKKLFDSMDYLAILSGTPIPNTVVDIYMLLSLLDKDSFPINSENSKAILTSFYTLFRRDPEFVRRVLNDRMLRRTVDDYLQAKFPDLVLKNDLEIKLEGEHRDAYLQLYNNDNIKPASKLIQLVKCSIDPNLVNPSLLDAKLASRHGRLDSSVYGALDDLIENIVDRNDKALIFSNLKVGVTDKLKERYKKYGALVIDSDITSRQDEDISLRESIRREFQFNPSNKVLITTTVMDEGVDLTAATDVIHLTLPYAPATFDQRNRRSQRIGEVNKDHVNLHIVKPVLDSHNYAISEGIERLLDDKRRIITYIIQQPFAISRDDLDEIKNGKAERSKHLIPLINSPAKVITSHLAQLKNQGFNKILAHYKRYPEEAEYIARLYASHWEGYYAGNTANLYSKVINALEKKEKLERKLDIASGPFSLSRRLGKPVVNLDINQNMLNAGKLLNEEGKIVHGNKAIQASFHQLPFQDSSFDLANCSLALQMSRLKLNYKGKEINEREQAFREINRVLRPEGYAIITLPHTIIAEYDLPRFHQSLEKLGFEVLPFSGFYKGPKDSRYKAYLLALKKMAEPGNEALDTNLLEWKMDIQLGKEKRKSSKEKKHGIQETREIKKEDVYLFYHTRKRKSLEESIKNI